jgi:hypothetical protein
MKTEIPGYWPEFLGAAEHCARKKLKGVCGDPLPENLSPEALEATNENLEEFQDLVRELAYAEAMDHLETRMAEEESERMFWAAKSEEN